MMDARQRKSKAANTRDLLTALRHYKTQAALLKGTYGSAMAADGMLHWLAVAAKELRENKDRKMVHVAASADMDQSTIYRFETHLGSPRNLDAVIAAYADDLDLRPIDIWREAIKLWAAAEAAKASDDESAVRAAQRRITAATSRKAVISASVIRFRIVREPGVDCKGPKPMDYPEEEKSC